MRLSRTSELRFVIKDSLCFKESKLGKLSLGIGSSNTQLIVTHMHLVDLLSYCLLGRGLGHPSEEDDTLLGIGEVHGVEDLNLPVLLDKSEDGNTLIGESAPKGGRDHPCGLHHGYRLR